MVRGLLILLALLIAPGGFAQKIKPNLDAFEPGEKLRYRIHYGLVNAGYATFYVDEDLRTVAGEPHYVIQVTGRTASGWDWFYKVRDYYTTIVSTKTLLPTIFKRDVREGDYEIEENYIFQRSRNKVKAENDKLYDVPAEIHDILSAVYWARSIDFSKLPKGTYIPIMTFYEKELFPVGATYVGTDRIETSLGTFDVYVIRPKLIEGRIFKDQRDMTLYVTADKNQIPVRIESAIFVGYIQADLIEYDQLRHPLRSKVD